MPDVRAGDRVGRRPQLDRMHMALTEVLTGEFRAVAVRGEPGIGKTSLLTELAGRAEGAGLVVLRGRATEFEQNIPFGVFIDAFEQFEHLAETHALDAELADVLSVLRAAALSRADDRPVEMDRYRLFRGVRRLFERQSGRGILLVLDDLHWADPASLDLAEYLLRRPPRAALLIAVAHRTAQPPRGLADALTYLASAAVQFELQPLRKADVAAMFPQSSARRHRLLHRATHGNPLYLQALADTDDQTLTSLVGQAVDDQAIPEQVLLDVLSAELGALQPAVLSVAQAAAIAGDPADPALVAWVADVPDDAVSAAFDQLSLAGVMVAEGPRFRFRHPLVRTAAYWMARPAWRTEAHSRGAQYLRQRHGALLLLAHHIERSAQPGDELAVATLTEAAMASQHAAPATAARLVRRAMQLLPDQSGLDDHWGELRLLLARTLARSGELIESRRLLHEAIRCDGSYRRDAVNSMAAIDRMLGQFDEAKTLLAEELERLPDTDVTTAQTLLELAAVELFRHDVSSLRRHAARAVEILRGSGNIALEATAHSLLSLSFLQSGDIADARTHIDRAARQTDGATDALLLTELVTVAPLAWVELHLQQYDRAERHLSRGIDIAISSGLTHSMPYLLIVDALARTRRGRLTQALEAAEEALEYSRIMNATETAAMAEIVRLCPILWQQGSRAALVLVARATRPTATWWSKIARLNLATVHLATGQFDLCLSELDGEDPDVYSLALRAVASARLGRAAEGRRQADTALDQAHHSGLTHQLGTAFDARARANIALGNLDEAESDATKAAVNFADAQAPIDEGRTRHLLAILYARTGQRDQMHAELGQAKSLYTACSATWLTASLARDELRFAARGPRTRNPSGGGLATLTPREREIVDLVTAGLTNREIAERLYVSKKTVEAHLSRAFSKLDVRSRVALTRRVTAGDPDSQ
ncbi:DNA-binding CsgD family transcriptional regulator/tetratricopeptide (TPR) repeat protein [Kibdelosporangium banguiense]|uniref:DNA-binding CsgD family transcriptional regulator/tetratricopeptide (TPR) repeat protein n=1 Tax=Kibdelosporangium banguiense TaxID=1365924 RepID=A0ABS4TS22_9PSEU|nr:LuxR family transcriptional regulator [Kibdelosporangium banguiense]MBP2327214.1 DNA-binding CsgD family transcriptional regulator/tetratricopeptide (TPR) repeat protein [Kibdelosporangium banguiense]